jgi:uncharacterized protein (DUF305 family)
MQEHSHAHHEASGRHGGHPGQGHYGRLLIMAGLSFLAMYALMYAMVNAWTNVLASVNQAYMAALMAAPMVIIELLVMRGMYDDRRRNLLIGAASIIVGLLSFVAIRRQTAVGDRQFLRSMIPHHGGAILMCEQASITDSEIQRLCQSIIRSQQAEIDRMKAKLQQLR